MSTEKKSNQEEIESTKKDVDTKELPNDEKESIEKTKELEEIKKDLAKEKDKFLRLFAEFENYKKRTLKERIELFKTANQDVMVSLLSILDDFDRALKEMAKSKDKGMFMGVELIHNKLKETLKLKGLALLEVKAGDVFDAEEHDAVTQIPAPDKKLKGKVVEVIEKGYKLGEKIIRHPKVVVGQ